MRVAGEQHGFYSAPALKGCLRILRCRGVCGTVVVVVVVGVVLAAGGATTSCATRPPGALITPPRHARDPRAQ